MTNYLLPNADTPAVINGVVCHQTEPAIAAIEARTNGTASVVIAGSVANNDQISLKFTSAIFTGGSLTVTSTDVTSDSDTNAAERLTAAIMANAVLAGLGLIAEVDPAVGKVDLILPGPLGSSAFITLSATTTGAETFTITQFSGGAGPIIPTSNFRFVYNGAVIDCVHGRRKQLDALGLAALVASGSQNFM